MDIVQTIRDAALFIENSCDRPVTVAEVAAQVYLSPSYLASLFRAVTGFTVANYRNRYRLYLAARALLESGRPVADIAYQYGFSSQQAFTKSFTQAAGIPPAKFRSQCPRPDLIPSPSDWKERLPSMDLLDCFRNAKILYKEAFTVAGIEVDIRYGVDGGTSPITDAWNQWESGKWSTRLPDQCAPGTMYGITHSETAQDTGKYIVCTEVTSLDRLPSELTGRRFEACHYAVFETNLSIIWSGEFWRTFYSHWLPESGYTLPDESLHGYGCTFSRHPAIEVYGADFRDDTSPLQIYAPIVVT